MGIVLLAMGAMATTVASAQSPRAGALEFSIGPAQSFSDSFEGIGGSSLRLSSRTGIRLGVDYFYSSKLAVGFDATWVQPSYSAELIPEDGSDPVAISHRSSIFNGHFAGTFYFTESAFTPYVEAGMGWTYIDSNISKEPPIIGCWWDPLWGYVCSDFYSTFSSTNFSYGAGLGLRWNYGSDRAVVAAYRWLEVEADGLTQKPTLESAALEFIFRF
jgi:opacity protein-like surface antigen